LLGPDERSEWAPTTAALRSYERARDMSFRTASGRVMRAQPARRAGEKQGGLAAAGAAKRPRPAARSGDRSGPKAHHLGISLIPSAAPILWRGAWAPPFQPAPPPILYVGVRDVFVPGSAPRRAAKQPLGPKGALPGCPNVGVRRPHPRPLSGEAGHSASVYGA